MEPYAQGVLGPYISQSLHNLTLDHPRRCIRFSLGQIKRVGDMAAENMIGERERNSNLKSFSDFISRVERGVMNQHVALCLLVSGAFGKFGIDRLHLPRSLEQSMPGASSRQKDCGAGQFQLFDMMGAESEVSLHFNDIDQTAAHYRQQKN
jgi:DNA polymerase-3 subunit alpha